MSDLISREAVLEYLSELCETKDTSAYGLQLMGSYDKMKSKLAERDCVKKIMLEINKFESAYDVDKVADSITDLCGKAQTKGEYRAYWKAAKIVKGAVKDE